MITKNYKNALATILHFGAGAFGCLPVTDVTGVVRYCAPAVGASNAVAFPLFSGIGGSGGTAAIAVNSNIAGISFGSGSTPATEDDYNLEETLYGANVLTAVMTQQANGEDAGRLYREFRITITNTSASQLVIREVGLKAVLGVWTYPGTLALSSSASSAVVLIDRTVLDQPLVLEPEDAGIITYRLMTQIDAPKTVDGVKIVSFTWGSDEEIAAMLDAAHAGKIDLQADGGWRIGDQRIVPVSAFTGGGAVQHVAQDIPIVISSFEDYNRCGCVMQFDFRRTLALAQRMNATGTNVGGYGDTEMYRTTIPALVDALPEWLRSRLITFNVLSSEGNRSSTIVTVPNNKLALRSEVEITGSNTVSAEGEGTQVMYYQNSNVRGQNASYFLRSPVVSGTNSFCTMSTNAGISTAQANYTTQYLAPFGCL